MTTASIGVAAAGSAAKVTICHVPPGDPGNAHTITIGEPALTAHLGNHPDFLGPCPPGNRPPEADAGEDQCVLLGTEATLDGSGSEDPDGDPLSFLWTGTAPNAAGVTLSDPNLEQPIFTPDQLGDYTFELEVSDGDLSDTDTTVVTSYVNVTLHLTEYEVDQLETVLVDVTIDPAAPTGGATLAIAFDDDTFAVATEVGDSTPIHSITIDEDKTMSSFELTGVAVGSTMLTVGDPTCEGAAMVDVRVNEVQLAALAERLGTDVQQLSVDLDELLVARERSQTFEDHDLWIAITDGLDGIVDAINDAVDELLGA